MDATFLFISNDAVTEAFSFLRVRNGLLSVLTSLLYSWTLLDPLVPCPSIRVLFLPLIGKIFAIDMRRVEQQPMPRHESQVRVRALVSYQVLSTSLL